MNPLYYLRVPLLVVVLLISYGMTLCLKISVVLFGWLFQTNYSLGIIFRRGVGSGPLFVPSALQIWTIHNIYLFTVQSRWIYSLTWVISITWHLTLSLIVLWCFWRTGLLVFQSTTSVVTFPSTLCGFYGKREITVYSKGNIYLCSIWFSRWYISLRCIVL